MNEQGNDFEFEEFNPLGRGYKGGVGIGINAAGSALNVTAAAMERLGQPERVKLLFDPGRRAIGIRAADGEGPGILRVSRNGARSGAVSAARYFKTFGITQRGIILPAEMVDDTLVALLPEREEQP